MQNIEFIADKKQASINWIESMRRAGFVFKSSGDPSNMDSYHIRKVVGEGDDTDKVISALIGL